MRSLKKKARVSGRIIKGLYESRVLTRAIGIFGRPISRKEFQLPPSLKERLLFDMTSQPIQGAYVWLSAEVIRQPSTSVSPKR